MTRILASLLQAEQPHFQLQLRELERIGGHQNTDIKLSVEVVQAVNRKIHALGLDRNDTTAEELYHGLNQRLKQDDHRLERSLRTLAAHHVNAEANIMDGMVYALGQESKEVTCFSVKASVLKQLIKKHAPKRVLKALHYRSLDAMLRAESPAAIASAGLLVESAAWHKSWVESYKHLTPRDFEEKSLQIFAPVSDRWQNLAETIVQNRAHTVMGQAELGMLLILPLPANKPDGMVVATMGLALHELNAISAYANYLRASQMHGDFAGRVQAVARGDVSLQAEIAGHTMPWQLVQQYYARLTQVVNEDVFGPYVRESNFLWRNVEERLAELCPSMEFWKHTEYLSFLHNGARVSLNVLDAAINSCNGLEFEQRRGDHARQSLWHELTIRYLDRDSVEAAVARLLQPQLAEETVTNE